MKRWWKIWFSQKRETFPLSSFINLFNCLAKYPCTWYVKPWALPREAQYCDLWHVLWNHCPSLSPGSAECDYCHVCIVKSSHAWDSLSLHLWNGNYNSISVMNFVKIKGGNTCKTLGIVPCWVNDQKPLLLVGNIPIFQQLLLQGSMSQPRSENQSR